MPTGAGALDRRIQIQRATEAQDPSTGGVVLTFADWITRWAHFRDPRAGERQAGGQSVATVEHVFEVRHDSDTKTITAAPLYRVVFGARVYDVVAAVPSLERNRMVYLHVKTRGEVAA